MFNRLFRRKSKPAEPQPLDYSGLFDQVMKGLAAGWSALQVQGCLAGHENDERFLQWLYCYDRDVLQQRPEASVIERLIQWGTMDCGAVGKFAGEIGERAAQSPIPEPSNHVGRAAAQSLIPEPSDQLDETLFRQGDQSFFQKDFEAAIVSYDGFLAIAPDHAVALSNKGACLAGLGRFEEAIATYGQALAINPDSAQVHYRQANALRNIGRFEEAVMAYDAALQLRPDYEEALNNKGTSLAALQQFEAAIAAYDGALAIDPQKYSCLNNKGIMLQQLGRFQDAIAAYDAALAINPKYSRARQNKETAMQHLNAG